MAYTIKNIVRNTSFFLKKALWIYW